MRKRTSALLALAAFAVFALTFDGFSVAAVYAVGFDGVARFLLTIICVVVGSTSAYFLTAALIRVIGKTTRAAASLFERPARNATVVDVG